MGTSLEPAVTASGSHETVFTLFSMVGQISTDPTLTVESKSGTRMLLLPTGEGQVVKHTDPQCLMMHSLHCKTLRNIKRYEQTERHTLNLDSRAQHF